MSALELIELVPDPGSWQSWDTQLAEFAVGADYRAELNEARRRSLTLAVLMGQGAGGAALALLPADRVIAAENSWLSALSPEGASALRYRTNTRAADIAESMDISAHALLRDGIADEVILEEADAATRPALFLHSLGSAIETGLCTLLAPGSDSAEHAPDPQIPGAGPPGRDPKGLELRLSDVTHTQADRGAQDSAAARQRCIRL